MKERQHVGEAERGRQSRSPLGETPKKEEGKMDGGGGRHERTEGERSSERVDRVCT